jgi:peptidoglycan/LPS O-acetylase OafA/YrhL
MKSRIPRLLLATSAAIFAFGAAMHAIAYVANAQRSISGSNLPRFLVSELKVLWLSDSTTLMALALAFGLIAAKPASASKAMIMLLAIVPAAITVLLYAFLGPFYPGHMLLAASAMVFVAGILMPASLSAKEFVD